jgi:hypothetical protein
MRGRGFELEHEQGAGEFQSRFENAMRGSRVADLASVARMIKRTAVESRKGLGQSFEDNYLLDMDLGRV